MPLYIYIQQQKISKGFGLTNFTHEECSSVSKCESRGGDRGSGPPPPGKSQVIWVSIGNKQLDPPGKSWTPLPLKNARPPPEP